MRRGRARDSAPLALLIVLTACAAGGAFAPSAEVGTASAPITELTPRPRRVTRDILAANYFFAHLPFVGCSSVTRVAANTTPACCTLSASDCAQRCMASPACVAFAVAVYSETPPSVSQAPPAGDAWQKCELFTAVDTSSCVAMLQLMPVRGELGAFMYSRAAGDVWDTYFLSIPPPQVDGNTVWAQMTVVGVSPAALASNGARLAMSSAVQAVLQELCCAVLLLVSDVRDPNTNASAAQGRRLLAHQAAPAVQASITVTPVTASPGVDLSFVVAHVLQALTSPQAQALLLLQLHAAGFANATSAAFSWSAPPAPSSALAPGCRSAPPRGGVVGLAVGLGAPLAGALAALSALLWCCTLTRRRRRHWPGARKHDVFVSYRRADLAVADQVHDKLTLTGLRVFYDRGGAMAGRPFEQELFRAVRDAPVFAPLVTLEVVKALVAHSADAVDFVLAELLIALHFARTGRVRLIFPLLVGEWCKGTDASGGGERDCLPFNPHFKAARDALPAVVPAATVALVEAMFSACGGGEALCPQLATATVRTLILGASAAAAAPADASGEGAGAAREHQAVPYAGAQSPPRGGAICGLLEHTTVLLHGPDEQAGLVLRYRYAQRMSEALQLAD